MSPHSPKFLICAVLGLALIACKKGKKGETTNPDDAVTHDGHEGHADGGDDKFAGREVVENWQAGPGDVTVCPISGKKFEVDDKSGRFDYQGHSFVFCCSGACLDKVAAEPGKYLDALVEEAGGPVAPNADPDSADGGAIDDGPD